MSEMIEKASRNKSWTARSEHLGDNIMPSLGGWEWIIILVIVLLVFGIGRIGKLGDELGKGVRAFREGVREGSKDENSSEEDED